MTKLSSKVVGFIQELPNISFDTTEGSTQEQGRFVCYDRSVYPPRLIIPKKRVVTDCANGTPQDVWGNIMDNREAYEHFFSCPKCQKWNSLENRW